MLEMKHTPGPWQILDGAILCDKVNQYGNFHIASFSRGDEQITDEDKANAKLIAAAPELLKALELMQRFWDEMPKGQLGKIVCDIGILNEAFIQTKAALKKTGVTL